MQQQFTKEYISSNRGCYSEERIGGLLSEVNEPITLKMIFESNVPLRDKYWFLCRKLATKEQNQQIAITVAEIVLPIYEKRYPDNKAPRECIEAAKQYIAGHISLETLLQKRNAAAAYADAAADAAAADAAADAAAAAAYADADAAADAAAAAAYAAYAAAAADAAIKKQLVDYLMTFVEEV